MLCVASVVQALLVYASIHHSFKVPLVETAVPVFSNAVALSLLYHEWHSRSSHHRSEPAARHKIAAASRGERLVPAASSVSSNMTLTAHARGNPSI